MGRVRRDSDSDPMMEELPEHVRRNRIAWDALAARIRADRSARLASRALVGNLVGARAELGVLPRDLAGLDAIELGCGTAYVSAWLARRGARPVGIDISAEQLSSARAFQREFGLEFPLWHGNAEVVPADDESFDLAISEYGASIWCDPYRWIPEAARLLRPGGQLIFLIHGVIALLTFPGRSRGAGRDRLLRPYFGMHRFQWSGEDSVDFGLPARRDDRPAPALRVRHRGTDRGPPA